MDQRQQEFRNAEEAFLVSEGLDAKPHMVNLERLGGAARVVIAGDGPPVLFVPGVMSTGVAFAGMVSTMQDYRCIMVDRPGTGLSPVLPDPPTTFDKQKAAADSLLVDILDGLGIERSHIVTTSLGGWTTFRSLAAHPDRFQRVAALAWLMGARMTNAPLSMRFPVPNALLPRRIWAPRSMAPAMLKMGGMKAAVEAGQFSEEMIDYMYALLRHTETFRNDSLHNPRPIGPRGPSEKGRHSPELLAKVTHPVQLFWGDDDLFGSEESAREFADLLPNATLRMVEGAGHAPWMDQPELGAQVVRDHLAG